MATICLQLLLALLALLPRASAADLDADALRRASEEIVAARPGEVVTASFFLPAAAHDRVLVESLALPAGWTAATPAGRLALAAGKSRTRVLAFQVPPDAPSGRHTVGYTVAEGESTPARASVEVDVARVSGLVLEVVSRPEYTYGGDPAEVALRVTNVGNAAERVSLEAAPEPGLRAELSERRVDLRPRASAELSLVVETRRDEDRPTERIVRVSAGAGPTRDEAVVILSIVPRPGHGDTKRRFPLRAGVAATTDGHAVGVQPFAEGRGALDARGEWTMDLLLRGPDARGSGAFADREEYRVDVAGPVGHVGVGDRVYALSPLTTPGRYARGVEAELDMGPVYAGAWYALDRFTAPAWSGDTGQRALGASVGAHVGEDGVMGLQLLKRFGDDAGDRSGDGSADEGALLTSLLAEVPVFGDSRVEAEVAMDATRTRPALAGRAEVLARLPGGATFTLREVAASPDYDGYERDVHRTQGSVAVPFSRRVAVRAALSREERNLGRDLSLGTAPLAYRGDAQVAWSLPSAWSLEAGLSGATRADLLSRGGLGDDDWDEGAARLQIARGAPRLYASLVGLGGARRDRATGAVGMGTQLGGQVAWSPSATLALRGRASWGTHEDAPSSLFAAETAVGVGGSWRPTAGLQADLELYRRFAPHGGAPATPTDHVDARAQYVFPGGAAVTARYRLDRAPVAAHSGLLSVSLPVGVPLGRRADVGRLEGRVYDADLPGHPGVPGVVLRVAGLVATTGPDGTFRFGRVPAGEHRVEVDRGSLGIDRVTLEELPLVVRVSGGGTTSFEVGVTDAASLAGRVVIVGFSPTDDEQAFVLADGDAGETRPAAGVAVIVSLGGERHTRVTDARGAFSIDGLRPGAWQVELPETQLPTYYRIDVPRRSVPLAAGGAASVELVVEPMVRMIHLFGSGPLEVKRAPDPTPPVPTGARQRPTRRVPVPLVPAMPTDAREPWTEPEVCELTPDFAEIADDECDGRVDAEGPIVRPDAWARRL